jgi:hypothetical protein
MLIREHDELLAVVPRPLHDARGVGRRAHDAAVIPDERLDRGRRVDVRHRHDAGAAVLDCVRAHAHLGELTPAHVELIRRRHVRHGTAGRQVGKQDFLVRRAQDVGAFGHEVHAAEDDELRGTAARRRARQLERIADEVRELDDLVALIVMPEDHSPVAQLPFGVPDPRVHLVVRQAQIPFGQRLPLPDARLLDVGQEFDVHVGSIVPAASSSRSGVRGEPAARSGGSGAKTDYGVASAGASSGASGPVTTL